MKISVATAPWYVAMLIGPALLVDNLAPGLQEHVTIMGQEHTVTQDHRRSLHHNTSRRQTSDWTLQLDGSVIRECRVDASTWSRLSPGDEIDVRATRFMHRCTSITHEGVRLWSSWLNGVYIGLGCLFTLPFLFRRLLGNR